MISNCGHDERHKYHGGKAGDQKGDEYAVINWYSRPWACVLRYPDPIVGEKIAELAELAARNENIGYDQYERLTYYNQLKAHNWNPKAILKPCESDCSASTSANIIATGNLLGIEKLKKINPSNTTSTLRKSLKYAGFELLTDKKYLFSDKYLLPGDVLLYDGHHVAVNLSRGSDVKATEVKEAKKSGWVEESDGWKFYLGNTGECIKNDWYHDVDKDLWYWFDGAGIMVTNTWYQYKGDWYYLNADGAMCKSQLVENSGKIYAVDANGKMLIEPVTLTPDDDGALQFPKLAK